MLFKLKETYNWNKFVKFTLISYNTSQQTSMCITSYYLMFEKDSKLLIKKVVLSKITILDRVIELIYQVPIFRENAKVAINKA